jgi:integrase/recombinase XerD
MELLPEKVSENGSEMIFRKLLVKYFNEELEALSPLTVDIRKSDIKKFFKFYYERYKSYDLNFWYVRDTREYIEHLIQLKYSPNYINRQIGSVRNFGKWLFANKYINQNPVKHLREIKLDEPKPKAIDDLTLSRLFKTAEMLVAKPRSRDAQDVRNVVIMQTLLKSGLRIEELLRLKLHQFVENRFVNVLAKGNRIRTSVPINKETADMIRNYVRNVRTDGSDYLYTNRYGHKLSRNGLSNALKKICSLASATFCEPNQKIDLHPHLFRHTHGKRTYIKTKDPVLTAKRLGHSSLQYVTRYATSSENEIEEILEDI